METISFLATCIYFLLLLLLSLSLSLSLSLPFNNVSFILCRNKTQLKTPPLLSDRDSNPAAALSSDQVNKAVPYA